MRPTVSCRSSSPRLPVGFTSPSSIGAPKVLIILEIVAAHIAVVGMASSSVCNRGYGSTHSVISPGKMRHPCFMMQDLEQLRRKGDLNDKPAMTAGRIPPIVP